MAKRCLFRAWFNELFDCEFLTSYGSLFQIIQPEYGKDLLVLAKVICLLLFFDRGNTEYEVFTGQME